MMTNPLPGLLAESGECRVFTLRNTSNMSVTISERGAMLCSWRAPDRYGRMAEVLRAEPDGAGGVLAERWQGRHADNGVALLRSAGGTTVDQVVHYRLDDDGSLIIDYKAMAESPAPLAAMAPPYFNLNGGASDIGDHMLQIDASYYVEVDAGGAPVGIAAVNGTPFDFRQPAAIGPRLRWPDAQIHQAGGFDHCYCVRGHLNGGQGALREVARVFDPGSGRRLQVSTTEAGMQFCSGQPSVGDHAQRRQDGFCLETKSHPDLASAAWPDVILPPWQVYRQTTVYRLSLQD